MFGGSVRFCDFWRRWLIYGRLILLFSVRGSASSVANRQVSSYPSTETVFVVLQNTRIDWVAVVVVVVVVVASSLPNAKQSTNSRYGEKRGEINAYENAHGSQGRRFNDV